MSDASSEEARARRAAMRRGWPVRRYALGAEPSEDLSDESTPSERLAMMWQLAVEAWHLAGRAIPDYARSETPGRVIRRTDG